MKTKRMKIIMILSLAVNLAVMGTVGYHYYRNACLTSSAPCPLNREGHHLYDSLGLSDEQAAEMRPLSSSFHAQLSSWESRIETKRDLLLGLLGRDDINQGRIGESRREIAALQDELQQGVVSHILQVKDILNPEQRKQFFEMLRSGMAGTPANSVFPITGGHK
jgi:Spy/CpxP family protein refolding chaperone